MLSLRITVTILAVSHAFHTTPAGPRRAVARQAVAEAAGVVGVGGFLAWAFQGVGPSDEAAASVAASAVSASWAAATTSATAAAASFSASSSSLDTRVGVGRGTWTRRRRGFGGAARGRISARAMSRASTRMRGSQGMRLPGWGRFFCDGFGGIIMFRGAAAAS